MFTRRDAMVGEVTEGEIGYHGSIIARFQKGAIVVEVLNREGEAIQPIYLGEGVTFDELRRDAQGVDVTITGDLAMEGDLLDALTSGESNANVLVEWTHSGKEERVELSGLRVEIPFISPKPQRGDSLRDVVIEHLEVEE
jgi:hypothetical protein